MWKTRTSISVDSTHTALTAARSHHSSLIYQLANKPFIDIRLRPGITTPLATHRHTMAERDMTGST